MSFDEKFDKLPVTIFDKEFPLNIDLQSAGHAIREDMIIAKGKKLFITNGMIADFIVLYGRLNNMAAYSSYLLDEAEARKEAVEALAWAELEKLESIKSLSVSQKKIRVRDIEIEYEGEKTNIIKEQKRVAKYKYLDNRGKFKIREMMALLDLGRSMLSWDKTELDRLQ